MTLRIPNDSAIDGILFNRHLNYFIPTSQSQQRIFDMAYFSGQRATEEAHLHLNRRISTHSCRCRTAAAVPEHRRSLCHNHLVRCKHAAQCVLTCFVGPSA